VSTSPKAPKTQYTCHDCGAPYEVRLSMSAYAAYAAGDEKRCPACGSENVERRITGCGVLTGSRSGSSAASCGGGSGFT
jgi:putative FmdB family regulatory protein